MTDPRVDYVLQLLLGAEAASSGCVRYESSNTSDDRSPHVRIIPSGFFGLDYGTAASLPSLPLETVEGVPLIFGRPLVQREGPVLVVHADIVASIYFLVTRYEEWVQPTIRDEHGRFPGQNSLPFRAGFLDRPVVEEYQQLLRNWLRQIGIDIARRQGTFTAVVTHDVDTLGGGRGLLPTLRTIAGSVLARRSWKASLELVRRRLGLVDDPLADLGPVLASAQDLTQRVGKDHVRQVFFFMSGGRSCFEPGYKIESERARVAIQQVLGAGAEVGLHASYEAGSKPDLVAGERQALVRVVGNVVTMNRHHYLRWCEPGDGYALANSGIRSDYTLGYADVAGFRLGVCHPIPLFDPAKQRLMGIEEHPLIVMDCSLSDPGYMNLSEDEAFACVRGLIEGVARHRGEFVMLWHHNTLSPSPGNYHPRLYPRVLDCLADRLIGVCTGED